MIPSTVAALYVDPLGTYAGAPGVDLWPEARDARLYAGPWPVVAHPPCQRWGRFWHGSPRKPHQFVLGDDGGCFEAALHAVRMWGGVLEHPADSRAWDAFGIPKPRRHAGWLDCRDGYGGATCYVEQGHYGHAARKASFLYACCTDRPDLHWSASEQRLDPRTVERHGRAVAVRRGVVSLIGGRDKVRLRNATPEPFRDVLLALARSVTAP